jgi:hypothetical protein
MAAKVHNFKPTIRGLLPWFKRRDFYTVEIAEIAARMDGFNPEDHVNLIAGISQDVRNVLLKELNADGEREWIHDNERRPTWSWHEEASNEIWNGWIAYCNAKREEHLATYDIEYKRYRQLKRNGLRSVA